MKKNILLAVFCLILSAISFAQVPQKMSYQAVVRGSDNNLVTNQQVAMRVSILQGSTDGTAVYTETHSAQTNANGLVSIEIGDGTSNDDFSAINWANGPFFVKTETDVNGGDDYDIIGVSQLLSVPYAMYAQTAGNVPDVSEFLTTETDPTVSDWAKTETKPTYNYSEIEGTPEIPTVPTNVSAFENDANYVVNEADPTVPAWAKAETKPVYNYSEIEGTPEIPTVPTNVSAFENDANYVVNEADPTVPAWAKAETKPVYDYSEITNTPAIPTVPTNVSAFENDANYVINEADPTVPAWAKANTKPVYDYTEILNTPTSVSAFENDANYLQSEADPTVPTWAKAENKPTYQYSEIQNTPTQVSAFENDANYLTSETDPSVPSWAKANTKPVYDYTEILNTPTSVSAFENDANYLQSESDPTVPSWAKAETKPSYSYEEITGKPELFSGNYNDLTNKPTIPTVPTSVSAFENDANYLQSEADPTVPAWAKANAKPTYSYDEITGKPTNVSAFTNDANYLTTEGDPTVPAWAKANTKPIYNYSEIQSAPTQVSSFENDANYISTESQTLADVAALGNSMNNTQIKNVATPTEDKDAATKKYVDDLIAALQAQNEVLQTAIRALTTGTLNGHGWVDLGLPSGTKWATCNVGSNTPEGYGDYFAWGETTTRTIYNSSTYTDNPTTLPSSADAATANWGSAWRMPTKEEFEELKNNCTMTWTTQNGVNGRLFTGPNGNTIFMPASGGRIDRELINAGSTGYYRSSSLYSDLTDDAWNFYFNSGNYGMGYGSRGYGLTVRAVCQSQN